jgi:hypothetical protein
MRSSSGREETPRIFDGVVRLSRLFVVGAFAILVATGCGAASHPPSGNFPVVVEHPAVQSSGLPNARVGRLHGNDAMLLSPSQVAFLTSGSVNCAWWPARLTVLGPSEIEIDMRVNGQVTTCGSGAVAFPIAVKIDPRTVDVHHPLTVRLAYKVRLGRATKQWSKTLHARAR